ncbi:MAG: MFS transporter [Peptococcaceae bacterium]|nr:MFS transporter [Peptococcaceae bacterium]
MMNSEKKGVFKYENFILITMFVAYGLVFMDRFGLAMLFPMIAPDLKLNGAQMGMTMSALALAWALSSFLFSTLSDIFGSKKKILIGAIFVFSLATMGTGLAQSFGFLLLMRVIMGIAEGPTPALAQATMMAASSPKRVGFNIGFVQSSSNLVGTAAGAVIVLGSAELFGWRGALNVLAVPGIIVGILLIIFMKEPVLGPGGPEKRPTLKEYSQVFKSWNVWMGVIMSLGMMASWLTLNTFFALYFTQVNNFTTAQVGTFFTVFGTVNFLASIILPTISDRIGRKPACIIGTFLAMLSTLAVLTIHSFAVLVPVTVILLILGAGSAPLFMVVIPSESVPKALVATAVGLIIMLGELVGGTIVPTLAGFMSDKYGITMTMWIAFGGNVIQFLPSLFLKETLASKVKKSEPFALGNEKAMSNN